MHVFTYTIDDMKSLKRLTIILLFEYIYYSDTCVRHSCNIHIRTYMWLRMALHVAIFNCQMNNISEDKTVTTLALVLLLNYTEFSKIQDGIYGSYLTEKGYNSYCYVHT